MLQVYRWATAGDDAPRRPSNAQAIFSRPTSNLNGITYASKDSTRDVQFVCHLPKGSKHATEAQQLAGSIFSRQPAVRGNLLTDSPSGERGMLEDRVMQRRRATEDEKEQRRMHVADGRYLQGGLVVLDDEDESEVGEVRAPRHMSTRSHDDPGLQSRHRQHERSVASDTSSIATSSVTSSTNRHNAAPTTAAQGWHHTSNTHTTYNMRTGTRQLFVSAPTGSDEAAVHDRLAALAVKKGASCNKERRIEEDQERRGARRWIKF